MAYKMCFILCAIFLLFYIFIYNFVDKCVKYKYNIVNNNYSGGKMGNRVKTKQLNTKNKFNKYLPVCIILCLCTIIIVSTFTLFTHTDNKGSNIKLSKVELSSETTIGVNGLLEDVLPGMPLIDGQIAFSKAPDSEPLYVRAKLSFSLHKDYQNDTAMQEYIDELRKSANFNIITHEQHGAVWSMKKGNYFYLLNKADTSQLKRVDNLETYVLSNEIVFPTDMKQLPNQAQGMKKINFHVAFEAIQADYIDPTLENNMELFDITFPAIESELYEPQEEGIDEFTEGLIFDGGSVVAYFGNSSKVTIPSSYSKTGETRTIEREFNDMYAFYGWATQMQTLAQAGSYNPLPLEVTSLKGDSYIIDIDTNIDDIVEEVVYPCYNTMEIETFKEGDDYAVTKIADGAFVNMEFMIVAQYGGSYSGGALIKEVVLPEGIEEIGMVAFGYQMALSKINIPSTVKTIGMNPFIYNMGLATIVLPEGLETIGDLSENSIPEIVNLSSIPNNEITYTDALVIPEIVNDPSLSKVYKSENAEGSWIFYVTDEGAALCGNMLTANRVTTPQLYTELTHYYTPSQTTVLNNAYFIPMGAFAGAQVDELTLSSAVVDIQTAAFAGSSIRKIDFGDGLTSLGEGAMAYCANLEEVVFGANLSTIGEMAFAYSGLRELTIPNTVTTLGSEAFGMCADLETVVIEADLVALPDSLFVGCVNLLEITLPATLESLGANSLTSLTSNLVHIYNKSTLDLSAEFEGRLGLEIVGDGVFTNEIIKTESATYYKIGDITYLINTPYKVAHVTADMISQADAVFPYAYFYYSNLQSIELPNSVKSIGEYGFTMLLYLNEVKFSNSIETIGNCAFYNTYNLSSVEFPATLQEIGASAFTGTGISEVSFANCPNVTIGNDAFSNCRYLTTAVFPAGMTEIPSGMYEDGVFTQLIIPTHITVIGEDAFRDCLNLTTLTLHENLTTINRYAFYNTPALQEIRIPASLTTLGDFAFGSVNATVYYNANKADWPFSGLTEETAGYKFGSITDGPKPMTITALDGDFTYYVAKGNTGCLVEGTLITLADGTKKAIEDITYDDLLITWNYDLGMYEYAYPVWIEQKGSTTSYTKVTLDDGTTISAVDVHAVFNVDLNRFVNMTAESEEFYVGTKVLVMAMDNNGLPVYENGNIKLVERTVSAIEIVYENVNYYQVLTANYFNVFANNVLTTEGNVILTNRYGFNSNVKWDSALRQEILNSGNVYSYNEFADIMEEYMFEALGIREGKYFVDIGYITKEEILYFIVGQATNEDMLLKPDTNQDGKRIWSVSTSFNSAVKVAEGDMFTLGAVENENFVGWRSSADGKIYNAGDSVKIMFATHFTAVYK